MAAASTTAALGAGWAGCGVVVAAGGAVAVEATADAEAGALLDALEAWAVAPLPAGGDDVTIRVTKNMAAISKAAAARMPHPRSFCFGVRLLLTASSLPLDRIDREGPQRAFAGLFEEKVANLSITTNFPTHVEGCKRSSGYDRHSVSARRAFTTFGNRAGVYL
jgi:hypothetical protein